MSRSCPSMFQLLVVIELEAVSAGGDWRQWQKALSSSRDPRLVPRPGACVEVCNRIYGAGAMVLKSG
ncbi:hypothetical protein chiPu_0015260 [Chiloscyllium punctatum]|uniref:Uncharacterized protein n=1 Tax=Chiloscyllium punctatum TaxID=137246 RepID=A0A401T275_CHIPU|nr:hypothetical protein [Chiloscyllium punctatum]